MSIYQYLNNETDTSVLNTCSTTCFQLTTISFNVTLYQQTWQHNYTKWGTLFECSTNQIRTSNNVLTIQFINYYFVSQCKQLLTPTSLSLLRYSQFRIT